MFSRWFSYFDLFLWAYVDTNHPEYCFLRNYRFENTESQKRYVYFTQKRQPNAWIWRRQATNVSIFRNFQVGVLLCSLDYNGLFVFRFKLYMKLMMGMGVNWSMEIVSWAVIWANNNETPDEIWYLTDFCNALYGVFIFFIFVFKKKTWNSLKKRLVHLLECSCLKLNRYSALDTTYSEANPCRPIWKVRNIKQLFPVWALMIPTAGALRIWTKSRRSNQKYLLYLRLPVFNLVIWYCFGNWSFRA